jgi:sugar transferase (PEP-CTERM/EpsH1 system associated)
LRFLSARANVDLACLADEAVSDTCRDTLRGLCAKLAIIPVSRTLRWARAVKSIAGGRSATEGLFQSPQMVRTLKEWSTGTRYDAVLIYCSSMGQYLHHVDLRRAACVVDLVDIDSQKWFDYGDNSHGIMSWLYCLEGRRVRQIEKSLAAQSAFVTLVSHPEADLLKQWCSQASIVAIPNGVDVERFHPMHDRLEPSSQEPFDTSPSKCVFIGALDYRANIDGVTWFCREVWPQVHRRFPRSTFVLVGRRPAASVRRLARLPGIELIGEVPDVRPYLHDATVVVVPLRIARGIQNKVLEAMAAGKAVIASPQALEGLEVVPEEHAYQAESAVEWLNAISCLLQDGQARFKLGMAGRKFVVNCHQWDQCLRPFEALLGLTPLNRSASSNASTRLTVSAR